jgi:hypothetical protein
MEKMMAETLLQYQYVVTAPDGTEYQARACGSAMPGGTWQGWIEFVPVAGGKPIRTRRETTQPNRIDTEYWATGVSAVYLDGALRRALAAPIARETPTMEPPIFARPASASAVPAESRPTAVLDPFSVYQKGEALLRKQLAALSTWHLVNIVTTYELIDHDATTLNSLPAGALVDIIVAGVRQERQSRESPGVVKSRR